MFWVTQRRFEPVDYDAPRKLVDKDRNRWSIHSVTVGRLNLESLVDLNRNGWSKLIVTGGRFTSEYARGLSCLCARLFDRLTGLSFRTWAGRSWCCQPPFASVIRAELERPEDRNPTLRRWTFSARTNHFVKAVLCSRLILALPVIQNMRR